MDNEERNEVMKLPPNNAVTPAVNVVAPAVALAVVVSFAVGDDDGDSSKVFFGPGYFLHPIKNPRGGFSPQGAWVEKGGRD